LRQTCRILSKSWLPSVLNGNLIPQADDTALIFALKSTEDPRATQPLINLFNNSENPDTDILPVIGRLGNTEELNFLADIAGSQSSPYISKAASGLLTAAKDRGVFPNENQTKVLQNLFASANEDDQATACALAGHWNRKEFTDVLKHNLTRPNASNTIKNSAAEALAMFGTDDIRDFLVHIISENHSINTTKLAVYSLVQVDLEKGIEAIANTLSKEIDDSTIEDLIRRIVRKEGAFRALSSALEGKKIASETARYASRYVQVSGREGAEELIVALAKAGDIQINSAESNNDQRTMYLISKLEVGDVEKGKEIYQRSQLACISCHKLKGVGLSDIGPDLGSIGASAPVDYIIESLTEPSKKIKEGYKSSTITTANGDFYNGSITFEDADKITIKTSTGAEVSIQKNRIKSRETSKVSMMPAGLTDALNESELIDLLKYLTELGKSQ
jgi:putative heme-binding domain-containing protein